MKCLRPRHEMTTKPYYPHVYLYGGYNYVHVARSFILQKKKDVLKDITQTDGKLRLIFATEAFGMGVDCADIRRVVNAGPPTSLESMHPQFRA